MTTTIRQVPDGAEPIDIIDVTELDPRSQAETSGSELASGAASAPDRGESEAHNTD